MSRINAATGRLHIARQIAVVNIVLIGAMPKLVNTIARTTPGAAKSKSNARYINIPATFERAPPHIRSMSRLEAINSAAKLTLARMHIMHSSALPPTMIVIGIITIVLSSSSVGKVSAKAYIIFLNGGSGTR